MGRINMQKGTGEAETSTDVDGILQVVLRSSRRIEAIFAQVHISDI